VTPLSVLYVDDDADIRTIVGMALALDPALTLTEAATGEEALALVSDGFVPDVAVVDMMMPGINGRVLMERLHRQEATAHVPVIVITARARAADIAAYRAAGAIGVITKPFDPLHLAPRIRALAHATENRDMG
jgi:CheY-like chemotaxis protein